MAGKPAVLKPGDRVGALVVKARDGKFAWCACDCGGRRRADASRMARGEITSCGCRRKVRAPREGVS